MGVATIVTRGYGSFGDIGAIAFGGYSGPEQAEGAPIDAWTVQHRQTVWTVRERTLGTSVVARESWEAQERVIGVSVPNRRIDWAEDNR